MADKMVGTLAMTQDALCAFEYHTEWIRSGFSISPFELPLRQGVFIAKRSPFDGGFGAFNDSLPDGWRLMVMEKCLQEQGINIHKLNILDRLALVGKTGRGALEFYPDKRYNQVTITDNFNHLALEVEAAIEDKERNVDFNAMRLERESRAETGMKLCVRYADADWLVKYRTAADAQEAGREEMVYANRARECGVEIMECRLFDNRYFGTKRFDRISDKECPGTNNKLHAISMAALVCADYRIPCMDYTHVFQVTGELTHSISELWKVFRLMCFNYLIGNKDDHAGNFSFLYRDGEWHLAPAYDLLPTKGMNGYHAMSFNDSIIPQEEDLLNIAEQFGLDSKTAAKIIDDMHVILKK